MNGHKKTRLITSPSYVGPVSVDWDAIKGKVIVTSADGAKKLEGAGKSDPKVPHNTYSIWPPDEVAYAFDLSGTTSASNPVRNAAILAPNLSVAARSGSSARCA